MVVVTAVAALSGSFQLMALLFRLPAVFAVFANGFLQVVLSFVDFLFTLAVPIVLSVDCQQGPGAADNHGAGDQRCRIFER